MIYEHMKTFQRLQLVKEIIIQLVVNYVILIPKNTSWFKIIDLSKQQALDADPKAIKQINFIGNVDRAGIITMFFIIEEPKETILDFSQELLKYCVIAFCFNKTSVCNDSI